jgi:shikimate dehydrogenase
MTKFINLIGYPVKHSISPVFQQAAIDYYALDIRYQAYETEANKLACAINQLRSPQSLGANITVPYKEKVIGFLDELDQSSLLYGAVNTVVNKNGKLIGFNTDAYGFITSLHLEDKFNLRNKRVMIIGAGGAARAISFAMIDEPIISLVISNRTLNRAESLANSLTEYIDKNKYEITVSVLPWRSPKLKESMKKCHLVVNCTTMGMKHSSHEMQSPLEKDFISPHALVFDLVYNPFQTPLLKLAAEAGAKTLNGLSMLVYQGARAFELWTGKAAPVDIMYTKAKEALSNFE